MRCAMRPCGPLQSGISMFSSRFHWDLRPNRLTRAIAAKRAAGARIFDLTESNPTQAGLGGVGFGEVEDARPGGAFGGDGPGEAVGPQVPMKARGKHGDTRL